MSRKGDMVILFFFFQEKISLNSKKGYNNKLDYMKSLTMRIKKLIYKLENKKKKPSKISKYK